MKRNDWVNKVVSPWKDGDVTQSRNPTRSTIVWVDYSTHDPIEQCPDLANTEYRLKPRTKKIMLEFENHSINQSYLEGLATMIDSYSEMDIDKEFADALRKNKII